MAQRMVDSEQYEAVLIKGGVDNGGVLYTQADYSGRLVKLASGSTSLFAEIETRGAYTPASGTIYGLRVSTIGIASN